MPTNKTLHNFIEMLKLLREKNIHIVSISIEDKKKNERTFITANYFDYKYKWSECNTVGKNSYLELLFDQTYKNEDTKVGVYNLLIPYKEEIKVKYIAPYSITISFGDKNYKFGFNKEIKKDYFTFNNICPHCLKDLKGLKVAETDMETDMTNVYRIRKCDNCSFERKLSRPIEKTELENLLFYISTEKLKETYNVGKISIEEIGNMFAMLINTYNEDINNIYNELKEFNLNENDFKYDSEEKLYTFLRSK